MFFEKLFQNCKNIGQARFFLAFCISCVGTHGSAKNRKSSSLLWIKILAFAGICFSGDIVVGKVEADILLPWRTDAAADLFFVLLLLPAANLCGLEPQLIKLEFIIYLPKLKVKGLPEIEILFEGLLRSRISPLPPMKGLIWACYWFCFRPWSRGHFLVGQAEMTKTADARFFKLRFWGFLFYEGIDLDYS